MVAFGNDSMTAPRHSIWKVPVSSHWKFVLLPLAVIFIIITFGIFLFWQATIDDAYISARYAKNLVKGFGLVFNRGERVEGFSNPIWVIFLSIGEYLALPSIFVAKCIGAISALACIPYIIWTWHKLKINIVISIPVILLFVAQPSLWLWSVAGLETVFYALVMSMAIVSAGFEAQNTSKFSRSALLCGIAAMIRPEGIALLGVIIVTKLAGGLISASKTRMIRSIFGSIFIFAITVGPYIVFRRIYYESWLPNTYFAKTGAVVNISSGFHYLMHSFNSPAGIALLCLAVPTGIYQSKKSPVVLGLFLGLVTQVSFTIWTGGDWMPLGRYIVPLLPVATILAGIGISSAAGFWNEHEMHPHLFSLFKFACIAVPLLFQVPYIYRAYGDYYWRLSRGLESRAALGLWMSKNLNENFTIAYGDAGMLAYKSMLPLLDMNGLVDKRIAQIRHNYFSQNIRDSIEAQYIVDRRPSMIILVTRDHPDKIWFPVDYGKELVNNSSFHTYFQQAGYLIAYPPKKVPAYPTGRFLVFFARRDVLISGFQRILCCINQAISTDQDPQQACLSSSAEQ